jgi:hypothetical protein
MATTWSGETGILAQIRTRLQEKKAKFWSDVELKQYFVLGCRDLHGAILDLHQDHYFVVNEKVVLKANDTKLSNVPENCFRVQAIEPRDISADGTGRQIIFTPKKWKHPDFVAARSISASDPGSIRIIYYQLVGAGSPVDKPTILTAPKIDADLNVRIAYNPLVEVDDINPIPGESDNALINWTCAWARAKEREDRLPDPGLLSVYSTEKQLILTRLTPRQEQEEEVVEDFFEGQGHSW